MPRSNLSDSEGVSLTSDDEAIGPSSPIEGPGQESIPVLTNATVPDTAKLLSMSTQTAKSSDTALNGKTVERPPLETRQTAGIARFRGAARRVMQMRTLTKGAGAEPGVDVRRSSNALLYSHLKDACEIEVIDYDSKNVSVKVLNNESFKYWITSSSFERKSWVKVRWINVGGLSFDVVRELGLKYNLHPLALEDLLNDRKLARSKADYFLKHLFMRIVCHELVPDDEDVPTVLPGKIRSASPTRIGDNDKIHGGPSPNGTGSSKRRGRWFGSREKDVEADTVSLTESIASSVTLTEQARRTAVVQRTLEELKKGERVNVILRTMCIFLTRDNTVISFYRPNLRLTQPISLRLKQTETSLRVNPDPSMLVHAILDLIVDRTLEVVDAYHDKIMQLERTTLLKPKLSTVRSLHILSGDLILHKRTMEPIKALVYGLRRYDLDRCIALAQEVPGFDKNQVTGFMSHRAKVYLADVVDHVDHIMSSMDMFSAIAENLINYTFNTSSSQMNEIMRRFTVITVICLPLTLLTGYFGMNFDPFWSVQQNTDLFFWELAIPILTIVLVVTLWSDFKRVYRYMLKVAEEKRNFKTSKKRH